MQLKYSDKSDAGCALNAGVNDCTTRKLARLEVAQRTTATASLSTVKDASQVHQPTTAVCGYKQEIS